MRQGRGHGGTEAHVIYPCMPCLCVRFRHELEACHTLLLLLLLFVCFR